MSRFLIPSILMAVSAFAADIPAGSHVLLRFQNGINRRTAKPGDFVYLMTDTPIAANGSVIVPIGSHVQGVVTEVNRGGKIKGKADLSIRLETLTLRSGQQYRFEPQLASLEGDAGGQQVVNAEGTIQQGSTLGKDVARVAIFAASGAWLGTAIGGWGRYYGNGWNIAAQGALIGAGAGAAVGLATVLSTRGKDVDLRQGMSLDVMFERPVAIQ